VHASQQSRREEKRRCNPASQLPRCCSTWVVRHARETNIVACFDLPKKSHGNPFK